MTNVNAEVGDNFSQQTTFNALRLDVAGRYVFPQTVLRTGTAADC